MTKLNIFVAFAAMLLVGGVAESALADNPYQQRKFKDTTKMPDVKANEVLIEVHGVVCSFCSKGVQRKLAKLNFVDTSRHLNGSLVEIEKQRVTLAIKVNAAFDAKATFKAIRDGGYDPVVAYVRRGEGDVSAIRPEGG